MDYKFENLQKYIDILKKKMKMAVVYAGDNRETDSVIYSTYHTRPWKSYEKVANDIANSLRSIGFEEVQVIAEDMNLGHTLKERGIEFVWLNSGGVQGFNPVAHAPAMLEMLGIPYVGHNPLIATLLDNKHLFKRALEQLELPTAPFMVWDNSKGALNPEYNFRFRRSFGIYRGPFVVKPITGRASLFVEIVEDVENLPEKIAEIYEHTKNHVLIERFLAGPEYCITVCGKVVAHHGKLSLNKTPFVFSEIERLYGEGERMFVSMDKKPITNDRARLLDINDDADVKIHKQLHKLAQDIYFDLDLVAITRIDVRSDEYGHLFVLEANPKPDLKKFEEGVTSLVAMGLQQKDMNYDDLILSLLSESLHRLFEFRQENVQHLIRKLS